MAPLTSYVEVAPQSHFSIHNIPFGIISTRSNTTPRVATAIGDYAIDLAAFAAGNGFAALSPIQPHQNVFRQPTLNAFAALGRPIHSIVRKYLQDVLSTDSTEPQILRDNRELRQKCLVLLKDVKMHLPFKIGDYTDFFVGLHHAKNCADIFDVPLQPNYKHLPVGYHGRASSVVVSGTPIRRPSGQIKLDPSSPPVFSVCRKLDFELELGCFVCKPNDLGTPVTMKDAESHLFGVVMLNDWSARDIQSWEMAPLGPFNAKNFGTSISPWVVTMDALAPFMASGIENDVEVLPYLREDTKNNIVDINLTVDLITPNNGTRTICKNTSRKLLFSFPQMLAHHTVGGCNFNVGDLMGSGTISSTDRSGYGAILEINDNGARSIEFDNGAERRWIEDGDTIRFTGVCGSQEGNLVGFGTCEGLILPAHEFDFYTSRSGLLPSSTAGI